MGIAVRNLTSSWMCCSLSWKAFTQVSMIDFVPTRDFVRLVTFISCWRSKIDIFTNFENITGSIELYCLSSVTSLSVTMIQLLSTVDRRFNRDRSSLTEMFNWDLVVAKPDWSTCSTENTKSLNQKIVLVYYRLCNIFRWLSVIVESHTSPPTSELTYKIYKILFKKIQQFEIHREINIG